LSLTVKSDPGNAGVENNRAIVTDRYIPFGFFIYFARLIPANLAYTLMRYRIAVGIPSQYGRSRRVAFFNGLADKATITSGQPREGEKSYVKSFERFEAG
jgi:hypothetical protein